MKGIKMTTNTESKIQEPTTIMIAPIKPKERNRYSNETVKEYKRYQKKIVEEKIKYENDFDKYKIYLAEEKYKLEHNGASMPVVVPEKIVGINIDICEPTRKKLKDRVELENTTYSALIKNWINLYVENKKISIKPSKVVSKEIEKVEEKIVNHVGCNEEIASLKAALLESNNKIAGYESKVDEKIANDVQPTPINNFLEKTLRDEIDLLKKSNSQFKNDIYKSSKVMMKFSSLSTVFSFTESQTLDYLEKLIMEKKSLNGGNL